MKLLTFPQESWMQTEVGLFKHLSVEITTLNEGERKEITDLYSNCLPQGMSWLLEGDVAMPRTRSAMKCSSFADCKWKKSPSGFVEVPYSISNYFCKLHYTKQHLLVHELYSRVHIVTMN